MPSKRSRGRGRGTAKSVVDIPRERIVTRNRGKPKPTVLKRRSVTPVKRRVKKKVTK